MKSKQKLIENFVTSCELLESRSHDDNLIVGTSEYSEFLQQIVNDLKAIKSSLKTRSIKGKANRKEADRIQSAVNALKYLSNKSQRILDDSVLNERLVNKITNRQQNTDKLTRDDIKSFLISTYESE